MNLNTSLFQSLRLWHEVEIYSNDSLQLNFNGDITFLFFANVTEYQILVSGIYTGHVLKLISLPIIIICQGASLLQVLKLHIIYGSLDLVGDYRHHPCSLKESENQTAIVDIPTLINILCKEI